MDPEGRLYVCAADQVRVFDGELAPLFTLETGADVDWNDWLILLADGRVGLRSGQGLTPESDDGGTLRTVDCEKKDWGTAYTLPYRAGTVRPGRGGYLFFCDVGDALYGYATEAGELKKLLSWTDVNVNAELVLSVSAPDSQRLLAVTCEEGTPEVVILTATDPAALPEDAVIFGAGETGESLLEKLVAMETDAFVDWEAGACRFDSEDFKALLEFCRTLPTTREEDSEYGLAMEGRQLLLCGELKSLDWDFLLYGTVFGGRCSFVGYPRHDGACGSCFQLGGVYLPDSGLEISVRAIREDERQQFMELLSAIDTVYDRDESIWTIIKSEAAVFFAGDRTVDETAALIQSRAELYINEKK